MIKKEALIDLYIKKNKSAREIASIFRCSEGKVNYWMQRHGIKKRTISDAIYLINNPFGNPFNFSNPKNVAEGVLYGLGVGLYWGEGTKRSKGSVRLGNTDSALVAVFIVFLENFFSVSRSDMKFGIQVFSDMSVQKCEQYWIKKLKINKNQLYKTIVTSTRGNGTYRRKMVYGVMTVYYNNTRLQELLCKKVEDIELMMPK